MSRLRTIALQTLMKRYTSPETASLLAAHPFTIFHGWPGVLYAAARATSSGGSVDDLNELIAAARSSVLQQMGAPSSPASARHPESFCFGARGVRWARAIAEGSTVLDLAPPQARFGYDSFANDAMVYFACCDAESGAISPTLKERQASWSALIAAELAELTLAIRSGQPLLLGFAHGAAGVLFRALLQRAVSPHAIDEEALVQGLHWLAEQAHDDGTNAVWPFRSGEAPQRGVPLIGSLCNGAIGHAILFLEAFVVLADERYLVLSRHALHSVAEEDTLPLGFCCGHAGKVALVSRFLRLGLSAGLGAAEGSLERLLVRIAAAESTSPLAPITGLGSCVGAACAQTPDSPVLDFFLPRISEHQ